MTTTIRNVTFDAADPGALARWWAQVFDSEVVFDDGHEAAFDLPSAQTVFFQRVPEPKAVKNRLHLCLQSDTPRDVEVERVVGLGATMAADHRNADGTGWAVLADPEGNEFCVLRSQAERGF
ncbi:VOC family protein [Catellatospora vulcania]|uniref:VOC family protein n=1 Tax=Catellatospora vulcania TaxID=1460450 RepID=UPI0012D4351B|nr:VOC family protein [Catellatospora vulcania]